MKEKLEFAQIGIITVNKPLHRVWLAIRTIF